MTTDRIAVYGTLVPGGSNAHVLEAVAGTWRTGTIAGTRHEDGWHGYPGLVPGGSGRVEVAVLEADDLTPHLARLDAFEGPGYRRVRVPVRLADGAVVQAWVYALAGPPTGT